MKIQQFFRLSTVCLGLSLMVISCDSPADTADAKAGDATTTEAPKPDAASIKAEIQAIESAWAAADNARDSMAVAAFYADDAVTYSNNRPAIAGKEAIQKDIAAGMAKRKKGAKVAYDVVEIFPGDNTVTEIGKITTKDSTGKVFYTGKYMAVWEKRNGKYVCIRDISNDDEKEK